MARKKIECITLPTLPLRDMVVYPHMVLPLFVGRSKSVAALNAVAEEEQNVFLLAQRNAGIEDPTPEDLHQIGTIARVMQVLKLPDGTVKVLVAVIVSCAGSSAALAVTSAALS